MSFISTQKRKKLYGLALGLCAISTVYGCAKNEEKKILSNDSVEVLASELSETEQILNQYNTYLDGIGSDQKLVEADMQNIEANTNGYYKKEYFSIRFHDGSCGQFTYEGFSVVETEDEQPMLIFEIDPQYDLFTGRQLTDSIEYNYISTFREFVDTYAIEPIGYTTQMYPSWSTSDVDYILSNYGEDILECFQKNGFPIPVYDVNDFYNSYEQQREQMDVFGVRRILSLDM